jgi:nuclear transport factor 2 (NTF2) superfamily protein
MSRPPLPPFTLETAIQKVGLAGDACDHVLQHGGLFA